MEHKSVWAASSRPIYSLDASNATLLVGGAEQAPTLIPLDGSSAPTMLYFKQVITHRDWITHVVFVSNDCFVSAAMDASLCLWDASQHTKRLSKQPALKPSNSSSAQLASTSAFKCFTDSHTHKASISSLAVQGSRAITASYDGYVRLFEISSPGTPLQLIPTCAFSTSSNHEAKHSSILPPLPSSHHSNSDSILHIISPLHEHLCLPSPIVTSATRSGRLVQHDLAAPSAPPIAHIQAHNGPISSLLGGTQAGALSAHALISSGTSDGAFRAFDPRLSVDQGRRVINIERVHPTGGITGCVQVSSNPHLFATVGGGDGSLRWIDVRSKAVIGISRCRESDDPATQIGDASNVAYSIIETAPGRVVVGWGDGHISLHRPSSSGAGCQDADADADADTDAVCVVQPPGMRNAVRCLLPLVDGSATTQTHLLAAGDDGIVCRLLIE